MKEVTIYVCEDGTRYDNKEEAINYEAICFKVAQIMDVLKPKTEECKRGLEYVQHNTEILKLTYKNLMELCATVIPEGKRIFTKCANGEDVPISSAAFYIENYSSLRVLQSAIFRLQCINMTSGREYDQPYWANHEEKFGKE